MKKIISFALLALLFDSSTVHASNKAPVEIPNLKSCPKLADESAYGDNNKSLRLLFQGKDGYIFRSRLDLYDRFEIDDRGLAIIKALSKTLETQGTTLVIALLPPRGIAASQYLPDSDPLMGDYDADKARSDYVTLIKKLNNNGIKVIGNASVQPMENVYKADQHWASAGARDMAKILAAEIKKYPAYKNVRKMEFKTTELPQTSFSGTYNEGLEDMCGFSMLPEHDVLTKTEPVKKAESQEDLFGETSADIVLVGTSNSKKNDNHLNFDGYLREYLSADVHNLAVTGGGLDDSILSYLGSEQARTNPAKILIWEIPGYYNLSQEDNSKYILQAIATAYGECKAPLATPEEIRLVSGTTDVLKDLGKKNINATSTYIQVKLDQPIKKSFTVIFNRTDGKTQTYSFKPSKRIENSGTFYFTPQNVSKAPLSHISLKTSKEFEGLTAKVTLCPLPKKILLPSE